MKTFLLWLKVLALIGFLGVVVTLGLLAHLYSYDPYGWLQIGDKVLSRDLWNERKDLYVRLLLVFFFGTIVFAALFAVVRLSGRAKIKLR